ncbi:MAG TPA: hypothetical protein VD883_04615, partial [Candidatus Omnitrophota bacterium]|nr:hypothetical protein [Candidatus Omnitrophota bacterium]
AIESFFVGIAHAHSSKIDGARLALDLKEDGTKPTIFSFTKEGESLIAKTQGLTITLDRDKLKNGRAQKKIEDSLSIQDLRTLTDQTNHTIISLLEASGIDTSIPVVLSINLGVLDNPSFKFYLDYLIAELRALKRKDKNVFLVLEGPEHLISLAKDKDNTLFLDEVPQDLKKAPVVNLTPSTKDLIKSQINVPVTLLQEGDIPAFKGLLALSVASGRINTQKIPQNYQDAYSTLAGQRLDTQDLKDILEGKADQKTILKGSLKPITKVAINKAIQLFKTMIRMVGAAA